MARRQSISDILRAAEAAERDYQDTSAALARAELIAWRESRRTRRDLGCGPDLDE